MATDSHSLLHAVADVLEAHQAPFAVIGAAALAVHGISRSTLDIDVLVTDRRVLHPSFWLSLDESVVRDIRIGDSSDPLAGVVRLSTSESRDVDIVVGRRGWVDEVLTRAKPLPQQGRAIPFAEAADLILLKLYAGGSQDRWDIEQLLARPDRDAVVETVERTLPQLPADAGGLWRSIREGLYR